MRTVGRFVTRGGFNDPSKPPDLILGACSQDMPPDGLKPGHIYDIELIMGEMIVRDRGEAQISQPNQDRGGPNWGMDVNSIIGHHPAHLQVVDG